MAKSKLTIAKEKNQIARLDLQTKRMDKIKNQYDAVEPNSARKAPKVERKSETQQLQGSKRAKAANVGRELERNVSSAKSIMHQFRVNVVGWLGKIQINIKDSTVAEDATAWFNGTWSKNPDYRDPVVTWSKELQNILASVIREGDCVIVIDDGVIDDSGQLLSFESDQCVRMSDKLFKAYKGKNDWTQDGGIIRDKIGKQIGYVTTGKRGLTVIDKAEDYTVYSTESARLIKNPWRLNQGRGVGSLLTASTNFADLYEILASELQSAKRASQLAGYTKRSNAVTDPDDPGNAPEFLPENDQMGATEVDAMGANDATAIPPNYENFEAMTSHWEYVDKDDEIQILDINRPNVALEVFTKFVLGQSGASMGLAKAYTLLSADSSYTSFRGDMILTWVTFYELQKCLERMACDWVAVKVLTWAMRKRLIKKLPKGWESSISWVFPKMPAVDELKENNATAVALKNGTTSWAMLLGPDWKAKLTALGEQMDIIKALGLPLSFFETKSGGQTEEKENE
jgi:capsid protein